MTLSELSRIDRAIDIQAPVERVWKCLTTSTEIETWFRVKIEGDLSVGNEVRMTSVHTGYEGQRFLVRIVEMTPPTRLVWQWNPGEVDPKIDYSKEPKTTVTFTIEATAKGSRLTVAETGFDQISLSRRAKVHQDNTQGWTEVVVWIQKHVEAAD